MKNFPYTKHFQPTWRCAGRIYNDPRQWLQLPSKTWKVERLELRRRIHMPIESQDQMAISYFLLVFAKAWSALCMNKAPNLEIS